MLSSGPKTPTSQVSSVPRRRKPEIELPAHVQKVKARGKTYLYLAKGRGTDRASKPIRLPDDSGTPEFWSAYNKALGRPEPKPPTNTVRLLIAAYKQSPEWRQHEESTKVNWQLHLQRIESAWGDLQVQGIAPKHVLALRDAYSATPGAANNMLRCLSSMLTWAVPREWCATNPAMHIAKLKGGEGYDPWPWELIEFVREKGPPWMWHATAIGLYTGQRQGDVLSMTWAKVRNGLVEVRQEKTKRKTKRTLFIPLHRDLLAVLETIPKSSTRILTSTYATPWTKNGFRSSWRKAIMGTKANPSPLRAIGDAGLVYHGLRKSAVCMLLEAGCTEAEVQAITGQSPKMIAHYSKQVNQRKLAASAILKLERAGNARL